MTPALVSVVVPACNEERWIEGCLESIAAQDHAADRMEVIVVVDAASTDRTRAIAERMLAAKPFARSEVSTATAPGTPENLNAGLASARGRVVCRVDARSRLPRQYVRRCAELLDERPEVVVVGGSQSAVPPHRTAKGRAIARALNNGWAMGWSRYRRGANSGPSDTVYLGAFRTDELRAAGGWSTALPTNQDFDLNRRLGANGVVWFDASLAVDYVPRPTLASLHDQYTRFGRWKVRYWRTSSDRPRPRQLVLATAPVALGACLMALARRPGTSRRVACAAVAAGVVAVEALGSKPARAGLAVHAWSVAALAAVGSGWLRGLWTELLLGRTR